MTISLTSEQLRRAADIKEEIESLNKQLNGLLGASSPAPTNGAAKPAQKRKMSAAGLASLRAAQKARWAKIKAAKGNQPAAAAAAPKTAAIPEKKKFKMSAAAKAKIAAAAKARWAKIKAEKTADKKA
jgi:hypothetical protein